MSLSVSFGRFEIHVPEGGEILDVPMSDRYVPAVFVVGKLIDLSFSQICLFIYFVSETVFT